MNTFRTLVLGILLAGCGAMPVEDAAVDGASPDTVDVHVLPTDASDARVRDAVPDVLGPDVAPKEDVAPVPTDVFVAPDTGPADVSSSSDVVTSPDTAPDAPPFTGPALRITLTWTGRGDLDLHLHNALPTAWGQLNDCFYGNPTPAWGAVFDYDNTFAGGPPEALHFDTPTIGDVYTVGVNTYTFSTDGVATVSVFCGGALVSTRHTTVAAGSGAGACDLTNRFFRVAAVRFTSPGVCVVNPLDTSTSSASACGTF